MHRGELLLRGSDPAGGSGLRVFGQKHKPYYTCLHTHVSDRQEPIYTHTAAWTNGSRRFVYTRARHVYGRLSGHFTLVFSVWFGSVRFGLVVIIIFRHSSISFRVMSERLTNFTRSLLAVEHPVNGCLDIEWPSRASTIRFIDPRIVKKATENCFTTFVLFKKNVYHEPVLSVRLTYTVYIVYRIPRADSDEHVR